MLGNKVNNTYYTLVHINKKYENIYINNNGILVGMDFSWMCKKKKSFVDIL